MNNKNIFAGNQKIKKWQAVKILKSYGKCIKRQECRTKYQYTNDGNYTIDNSLAERSIRPFTIGRKNFVSFGSEDGPKTAAVYYTFVETCKMRGISPKDYFTDFFRAILTERRDYEALVPAIIG